MQFVSRAIVRITLLLFVLLAIIAVYPGSARASGNTGQTFTTQGSSTLSTHTSILKKRNVNPHQGIPDLPVQTNIVRKAACPSPCNLLYHSLSGQVELQPKAYLIFWGPNWKNASGKLTPDGQIVKKY
ncbi:MAG TPA: hypothetical protein VFQ30_15465, partial [Ktedonobacteraceae bacterium]|nr:hypothetical protein [Ktedonobacteraceae bacterium]